MNDIAVIIPMHNLPELTDRCVDATIKNAGLQVDIIVVDDGSTIPYKNDKVSIIRHDVNMGFTEAINTGIRHCIGKYEYIHLLSNDTIPCMDFSKKLYETLQSNEKIAVASSVRETPVDGVVYADLYPQDILSGYSGGIKAEEVQRDGIRYCPWIPFCSLMIRTDIILRVGLLDSRMRNYCSDNDFCVRAGELGYDTVLVYGSRVEHIHGITMTTHNFVTYHDNKVMAQKVRCDYRRELLDNMPLDFAEDVWGKLEFTIDE